MSNAEFIDGLFVNAPRDNAPDFVKGGLGFDRLKLIAWLESRTEEKINAQIKVAKSGKWYAAVDSWKPNSEQSDRPKRQTSQRDELRGNNPPRDALGRDQTPDFADDEIPF